MEVTVGVWEFDETAEVEAPGREAPADVPEPCALVVRDVKLMPPTIIPGID